MNRPDLLRGLLRRLAPDGQADDVLGDLEEGWQRRRRTRGPAIARMLTTVETFEMALALLRSRIARARQNKGNSIVQDYKLGLRMLAKYPGLTIAGGLALALAIGLGAGWYDFTRDLLRPAIPLADGHRLVEIEMRDAGSNQDERRLLHEFVTWRRDLRSVEDLGAYRTLERNLILGDAQPETITVAETTASAFRIARVAPALGRPLVEADEGPGAPPVAVLGHRVWQHRFGGDPNVIGRAVGLGRTTVTIVGVMPEGFAFPVNHSLWVPIQVEPAGYAPLEGAGIRVFGRLAPNVTQAEAYAEVTALNQRTVAESPRTHEHLRPRVLAYGGESPGDRTWIEFAVTHLPIIMVLIVACANVGTLIYARTATREAEIAMRYALGASRGRIVTQLFVEALVLASLAAIVGLAGAHRALKWGMSLYYSGLSEALPFWISPGLKLTTVLYAAGLTVAGAALLSVLPALKITGRRAQSQLRNLGTGGSTLRFGGVWTTVMIGQVALTVICIPPAMGITQESVRDRLIRERFPAEQYLAARIGLDREGAAGAEADAAYAARFDRTYGELARQLAQEPGVVAVTFGSRLPGMGPSVGRAEVEASDGAAIAVTNLWTSAVGPGYFESFDVPLVAGRDFHDGDRRAGARTVLVNEAFARRYTGGATPVGRRVRFADRATAGPDDWFEIVGMVRDVGMTPTDLGEAPYVFRPVRPATVSPLVLAVRTEGDAAALAPRLRALATALDPGLRLGDVQRLDELVWQVDVPNMAVAGGLAGIVGLGLFMSAAGIFSLMSVSVARRTREIGLRAALGASPTTLLAGIFSRALVLIGSGVAAGIAVLVLVVSLSDEVGLTEVAGVLAMTSALMLTVGLLACLEPARRALRIQPTDALKEG